MCPPPYANGAAVPTPTDSAGRPGVPDSRPSSKRMAPSEVGRPLDQVLATDRLAEAPGHAGYAAWSTLKRVQMSCTARTREPPLVVEDASGLVQSCQPTLSRPPKAPWSCHRELRFSHGRLTFGQGRSPHGQVHRVADCSHDDAPSTGLQTKVPLPWRRCRRERIRVGKTCGSPVTKKRTCVENMPRIVDVLCSQLYMPFGLRLCL